MAGEPAIQPGREFKEANGNKRKQNRFLLFPFISFYFPES